jgi:hypothetical protein
MKGSEDAIFGNSLFRDRVVEVDYDKQQRRVHPRTPPIGSDFVRHSLAFDNSVLPKIEGELLVDGAWITERYLFDTRHTGPLVLSARQTRDHNPTSRPGTHFGRGSRRMFRSRGFRIGAVADVRSDVTQGYQDKLPGNPWLRRVNVILDNRQGAIWLAPTRETRADRTGAPP